MKPLDSIKMELLLPFGIYIIVVTILPGLPNSILMCNLVSDKSKRDINITVIIEKKRTALLYSKGWSRPRS